jgi:NAD+ synthase (glutamine-hydrolysing)
VVEQSIRAAAAGADLVAFPEMMLTGYPIEDLALRRSFQRASQAGVAGLARELAEAGCGRLAVVTGFLAAATGDDEVGGLGRPRGGPRNAAAVLYGGEVRGAYAKHHLPNYGVFDEFRYFLPGTEPLLVRVKGVDVAIAICEDLWQEGGPVAQVSSTGAGLLLVLNGSPYERSKDDQRLALCQRRAAQAGCPLAYVNMVGGQDELVFDGDSMVVHPDGQVVARAHEFVDELLVVDLDLAQGTGGSAGSADSAVPTRSAGWPTVVLSADDASAAPGSVAAAATTHVRVDPMIAPELADAPEVYLALTLGLRDYVHKNGFTRVALGLSGGIDSALVAAIACDAVGAANVIGVSMPSRYSSGHSRDDAADLAASTGLEFRTVPIASMVNSFEESLELSALAEENLQARVRGVILMAISNSEGALVLATGNKSEVAVGYSTIYGDAVGGFAPIKDVPKSLVWELSRWRNAAAAKRGETPPIPTNSIIKEPSAELRPDQRDSDSLPDYADLDALLDAYVEQDSGAADLVAAGFDPGLVHRVLRLIDTAEYKRRQYPPGSKITYKAFGRDRRLPITSRWRETVS